VDLEQRAWLGGGKWLAEGITYSIIMILYKKNKYNAIQSHLPGSYISILTSRVCGNICFLLTAVLKLAGGIFDLTMVISMQTTKIYHIYWRRSLRKCSHILCK
jgi:hypothetical protein